MVKKSLLVLALAALAAGGAFALLFVACEQDVDPDGDDKVTVKVITGKNLSDDWSGIVNDVNTAGKKVILDLSACEADDNAIAGSNTTPSGNDMNIIKGNTLIKGIILPESLVTIGDYAFYNCTYLTSVTIPESVTTIGEQAFRGTGLTSVSIPSSVTEIGNYVFAQCNSLISITVEDGNSAYISNDGVLFDYDQSTLIQYPASKSGASYTVPAGVTTIDVYAFYGAGFTSVSISADVDEIGEYAFSLSSLTSVTIPNGVLSIGERAFYLCIDLASAAISESVNSIGNNAFYLCQNLTGITVDGSNTTYSSADGVLFDKAVETLIQYPTNKSGTAYTVPGGVATIGSSAFSYCKNLTQVTIDDDVEAIELFAFSMCDNLTKVIFVSGSEIDAGDFADNAFEGDLKSVYGTGGAGTYNRSGNYNDGFTWAKQV